MRPVPDTTPAHAYAAGSIRIPAAAKKYGVSRTWLYDEMSAGRLPFSQLTPRMRVIPVLALQALIAAGEGKPSVPVVHVVK